MEMRCANRSGCSLTSYSPLLQRVPDAPTSEVSGPIQPPSLTVHTRAAAGRKGVSFRFCLPTEGVKSDQWLNKRALDTARMANYRLAERGQIGPLQCPSASPRRHWSRPQRSTGFEVFNAGGGAESQTQGGAEAASVSLGVDLQNGEARRSQIVSARGVAADFCRMRRAIHSARSPLPR
ncbi:hypothetical protein SKAU_G00070490 [Synaphobranchus kaupii]|uniref:Uncharacterized protein n=1 Tax=Synaphobranchus kaupii TaxID=118154 RepID=A0A9Q1J9G8_SYNKA|nr:hypothetical protein SKAU_G00070490 [Synaphobranchus kaupii]